MLPRWPPGQRRPRLPALQALSWAALWCSAAAGGGGDDIWWAYEYEYFHLECFVVAGLVCLAMVFDTLHHKLVHLARHNPHSIEEGEQQQVHHDNEVTLWESILNQCSGELMVLGFLAFVVWIVNRAGLFSKLAKVTHSDHIRLPPDGYGYLHIVEDVHMQLFIAMLLYVFVLSLVARGTRKAEVRWETANEHVVSAYEVGLDPMDMDEMESMDAKRKEQMARFITFRTNFLASLEQWRGSWDLLDTELEPLLLLVRSRPEICGTNGDEKRASRCSTQSKEDDVCVLLRDWFPFDQYLSLQCRFLVTNLVQIKASTWGFFCINVLVKAVLMRYMENAEVRHIFDALLVAVFLLFFGAGVWQVSKQRKVSKDSQPVAKRQMNRQGSLMVRESVRDLCIRHSLQAANLVDTLMGVQEEDESRWDAVEEEDEEEDSDDASRRGSVDSLEMTHKSSSEHKDLKKEEAAREKADDVKAQLKIRTLTCLNEEQYKLKSKASPCGGGEDEFRQTLMNRLAIEEPSRCMLASPSPRPTPGPTPRASTRPLDAGSVDAPSLKPGGLAKVKTLELGDRRQSLTQSARLGDLGGRRTSFTGTGAPVDQGRRTSFTGQMVDGGTRRMSLIDKAKTADLGRRTSFTGMGADPGGRRTSFSGLDKAKTTDLAGRRTSLTASAQGRARSVSFADARNGDVTMGRRRSSILPVTAAEVKQIAEEKVAITLAEHKDYPWMTALTLLQIMLFSTSLSLVRFIANVHWWQDNMARPLICTIVVSICAPVFGILLGRGIPWFSMILARTEFMQARNIHWVSVILEDHVTGRAEHCRLSSRRLVSQKRKKSSWDGSSSIPSAQGARRGSALSNKSDKGNNKRSSLMEMITSLTRRTSLTVLSSISQGTRNDAQGTSPKKLPSIRSCDSEEDEQHEESTSSMKDVYTIRQPADSSGSDAEGELEDLPGRAAIDAD